MLLPAEDFFMYSIMMHRYMGEKNPPAVKAHSTRQRVTVCVSERHSQML